MYSVTYFFDSMENQVNMKIFCNETENSLYKKIEIGYNSNVILEY